MDEYKIVEAALDGLNNYLEVLEIESEELEISILPYFNEEGATVRLDYQVRSDHDKLTLDHSFKSSQGCTGEDHPKELDQSEWVEKFIEEFPDADYHYISEQMIDSFIEDPVESTEIFIEMIREEPENLSILIDPFYDEKTDNWELNYYIRADIGSGDIKAELDMWNTFDGTEEEFKSVYPLWIKKFKDEFPNVDIYYPSPDEL